MTTARHLLVMAGGTGGHVFPGLAVADLMQSRGWTIHWLGNPRGMESVLVPKHGFSMEPVNFGGVRGKGLWTKLLLPMRLARACWQSAGILGRVKPQVVLGLGGYITFPGGLMARLMGYPLVLHEQNSVAGMANRVLAKFASRVLAAFPNAIKGAQWVGNPVRSELATMTEPQERFRHRSGALKLLVLGGSLGAQALNQVLPATLAALAAERAGQLPLPQVVHQTGRGQAGDVEKAYRELGIQATVSEFIDDMASAYAAADLVICRAGAMTVSELAATGVASVLVPYPHAVDDHQTTNARFLADAGAGWLLPQSELTVKTLASLLSGIDRPACLAAAVQARSLAKPQATNDVADSCEALAR